jgi:hypothetical protein
LDPNATLDTVSYWDVDEDTVPNACDCAPEVDSAFASPSEILNLGVLGDKATFFWDSDAAHSGSGTVYDVLRASLFPIGSAGETCIEASSPDTTSSDVSSPAPGSVLVYLVRGRNVCAAGSYGVASDGMERVPSVACP